MDRGECARVELGAAVPGSRLPEALRQRLGPWESMEAIEACRSSPASKQQVARMKDILESFEPRTLELVLDLGVR